MKFTRCQTVLRNSLKESPDDSLKDLWKSSSCHTNIQYDVYKSTKEVLKDFGSNQEDNQYMARWGLSQSPDCSFCINPESLLHVVAGCQQYLNRFTWRHDSILNFIAKLLQPVINVHSSLYADVNGFLNNNW